MAKAHFVVDTTGGGVDVKTTGSFFFELSSYTEDGTKKISVVLNADGKAVRREYSIETGKLVAEEIIDLLRLHKEAE